VFVQQEVSKLAHTALEFPPMQKGGSFNMDARQSANRGGDERQAGN